MSVQLFKTTNQKGCALWKCRDNQPISANPQAEGVSITLPEIAFPTVEVNIMGNVSIPDYNRVENMTLTANISLDNPDSAPLLEPDEGGLSEWKVTYCVGNVDIKTGLERLEEVVVFCKGYISGIPNSGVEASGDGKADISMNVMAIRKIMNGEEVYNINRFNNVIIVNGKSFNTAASKF